MARTAEITNEIASNCLAVRARIASRDITKLYDDALRPLGLRITQLNILVAVAELGEPTPSRIGEALHLDRSTLSRTLERMKQNGWLTELTAEDGRSRPVKLSDAGRKMIHRAYPVWQRAQQEGAKIAAYQPK